LSLLGYLKALLYVEHRHIIGDNIRHIREKRGWTQEDLAIITKMSRTFIGDIERAKKSPTMRSLDKIAGALHVESQLLLKENGFKTVQ